MELGSAGDGGAFQLVTKLLSHVSTGRFAVVTVMVAVGLMPSCRSEQCHCPMPLEPIGGGSGGQVGSGSAPSSMGGHLEGGMENGGASGEGGSSS